MARRRIGLPRPQLTTNAPLTDKLGLFGFLGIKRSKDGPNIIAKVMHASNKNVCVVARYVQDQTELNNIPEGDLLGPHPYGGIEGARISAAGQ